MSLAVRHTPEHRGEVSFTSGSKTRESATPLHPSIIRLNLPDARRARVLDGVKVARYAARLILAICPGHISTDCRASIIASRSNMSHSTVLRLLTEKTERVDADYILQLAFLLRSQGGDPLAVEGGEVISQLFGGAK